MVVTTGFSSPEILITTWMGVPLSPQALARGAREPAAIPLIIGPPGPSGVSSPFVHEQTSPSAEWVVNHFRGCRPLAAILSPAGDMVAADVRHISVDELRVYFNQPQMGQVIVR